MVVRATAVAIASAGLLGLLAPTGARAACAGPPGVPVGTPVPPPPTLQEEIAGYDVVFEGVALGDPLFSSGPLGTLPSPARLAVTRYLKGRGPRVVRIATADSVSYFGFGFIASEGFSPRAGRRYRLFVTLPRGRRRIRRRETILAGGCGTEEQLPSRLRPVRGSFVLASSGAARWSATLTRRRRIACVLLRRRDRRARYRHCERLTTPGPSLMTVVHDRTGGTRAGTVVLAAGRRLERLVVSSPDGVRESPAVGAGRIAMVVFEGFVSRPRLEARADFRGGRSRWSTFGGAAIAEFPDPAGEPAWVALANRGPPERPRPCVEFGQDSGRFGSPPVPRARGLACGSFRADDVFLAVRRLESRSGDGSATARIAVGGAAGPSVAGVHVRGVGLEVEARIARRGRAFIAVLPGDLSPREIAVEVRYEDGSTLVSSGRSYIR